MNSLLSVYLDALRVYAAGVVALGHALGWSTAPHDAVIIFFVLSGFLISYASTELERSGTRYAISRIARVSSVAIPAIILSIIIDHIARPYWPAGDPQYLPMDNIPKSIAVCLSMIGNIWDNQLSCFSNAPYWSLTYEVWYYIFFGVVLFAPSRTVQIVGGTAIIAIMGPKLWVLMPCWLFGVGVYFLQKRWRPSGVAAWVMIIAPIAIYLALQPFDLNPLSAKHVADPITNATGYRFWASNAFPNDWLTAALVAINILGVTGIAEGNRISVPDWLGRGVKAAAGVTFSVYLYADPLNKAFSTFLPGSITGIPRELLQIALAVAAASVIALATEHQKGTVRAAISAVFNRRKRITATQGVGNDS